MLYEVITGLQDRLSVGIEGVEHLLRRLLDDKTAVNSGSHQILPGNRPVGRQGAGRQQQSEEQQGGNRNNLV